MIRPIMKMPMFLQLPSVDAGASDAAIVQDLVDTLMRSCMGEFTGRTAQAIQHEIDHTNGVLI